MLKMICQLSLTNMPKQYTTSPLKHVDARAEYRRTPYYLLYISTCTLKIPKSTDLDIHILLHDDDITSLHNIPKTRPQPDNFEFTYIC